MRTRTGGLDGLADARTSGRADWRSRTGGRGLAYSKLSLTLFIPGVRSLNFLPAIREELTGLRVL